MASGESEVKATLRLHGLAAAKDPAVVHDASSKNSKPATNCQNQPRSEKSKEKFPIGGRPAPQAKIFEIFLEARALPPRETSDSLTIRVLEGNPRR